jgi:hypothetical protein
VYNKIGISNKYIQVRKKRTANKINKPYVQYIKYSKYSAREKRYIIRRSMHHVRYIRYRLHQCTVHVYTKLALQVTDTQTHKCTVKCTVSSWRYSGAVKKQKESSSQVYTHRKYNICILGTFGPNICNVKNPWIKSSMCVYVESNSCTAVRYGPNMSKGKNLSEIGSQCMENCKRVIYDLGTIVRRDIGCGKLVNGGTKVTYKTVSRDYGNISVPSKMEAKSEDGPEMDVDGTTPDVQNGKKRKVIYRRVDCSSYIICIQTSIFHKSVVRYMHLSSNHNVIAVKPSLRVVMLVRIRMSTRCHRVTLSLIAYMYICIYVRYMDLSSNRNVIAVKPSLRVVMLVRMHMSTRCHRVTLNLIAYMYNIVQSLTKRSVNNKYVIAASLPYELGHMHSEINIWLSRVSRYRE